MQVAQVVGQRIAARQGRIENRPDQRVRAMADQRRLERAVQDVEAAQIGAIADPIDLAGLITRVAVEGASVADLRGPMEQLSALRAPLEEVGSLAGPMGQLATLTSILNRPMLLVAIALGGLLAWGLVTFLAVRMAIVSARRADMDATRG